MRGRVTIALLVGALLLPALAAAQASSPSPPVSGTCLESIPDSLMRRVPVYLAALPADSSSPATPLDAQVDLLTQTVAQALRALLGTEEGVLPQGEPRLSWLDLPGDVVVVARRDGRLDAHVLSPRTTAAEWARGGGPRLVARAVDTAYAHGERFIFPDSLRVDSTSWRLRLRSAVLDEQGAVTPPKMRFGVPVFSVMVPPERQVSAERVRVRYPDHLRRNGFMGNVKMEFVVDTTGRVDEATIRDLYPAGAPPLNSTERAAYDSFLRAIREGLGRAQYRPARIGGCLVRQMVMQPFTFALDDGRQRAP